MERKTCEELGCDLCHEEVKEKWRGNCAAIPKEYRKYWKFPALNPIQANAMELYDAKGFPSFVACSGTGTGKTVIAERAIIEHIKSGKNGKIVYLSPLKALASEKMTDWNEKFGIKVVELTSDTKDGKMGKELNEYLFKFDLILTSYEMFNSWSRKTDTYSVLNFIDVVIVDEVHNLASLTRGGELDGAITRFMMHRDRNAVQLVLLSATFDNVDELQKYCNQFVDDFQIVNLEFSPIKRHMQELETYVSFRGANEDMLYEMCAKAYREHKEGRVLGLMYSRKGVESVAYKLNKEFGEDTARAHNASMGKDDRKKIEDDFRAGDFGILVASPTIAMGLNLPGQCMCVIADYWDAYNKVKAVIPKGDLMQIIGRAGRPPFFKDAYIYVAVNDKLVENYHDEMKKPMRVEGKLINVLDSVINAEVFHTPGIDLIELYEWLKRTFSHHSVGTLEEDLKTAFKEEVMWLIEHKFVMITEDKKLHFTAKGRACAISMHRPRFINHIFGVLFNANFIKSYPSEEWSDEQLVSLLSDIYESEYSNVQMTGLDEDMLELLSFKWITARDGNINWSASAPEYAFIGDIKDDLSRLDMTLISCGIPRTSKEFEAFRILKECFGKNGIPLDMVRLNDKLKSRGVTGVGNKRLFVLYANGVRADSIVKKKVPRNLRLPESFSANSFLRNMEVRGEVDDVNRIEKIYPSYLWGQHYVRIMG